MGKSDAALNYKSMSPDDRRTFDRWLNANAIFGLVFAAVVVAILVAVCVALVLLRLQVERLRDTHLPDSGATG